MGVAELFDALCERWIDEAGALVAQSGGQLPPTLVVLPARADADEVAIRLEGLRGNLAERANAIVAELRPVVAPHEPVGLAFMTEVRDGAAVYVSLGAPALRRAFGFRIEPGPPASLVRSEDPATELFAWLDALLVR